MVSEAITSPALTVRNYSPSDYPLVCSFWASQGWPQVPAAALPATGRIVQNAQGRPLCAGFLYRTDSTIAWVEWIVADAASPPLERSEALDLLIGNLEQEAKSQGFQMTWTGTSHARLIERYKSHGWSVVDAGQSHLIKKLS